MKLSEICIKRPVFTIVLSLIMMLLGVLGFSQLTTRFDPYYFRPHLTIFTSYPGASAQAVEMNVTQILENALNGTPGTTQIYSQSQPGYSMINISFKGMSQQQFVVAQSQVLQEIAGAKLPQNAQQPKVFQGNSGSWTFIVGLTDPSMNNADLNNFVNNVLETRLNTVPGVGNIQAWAGNSSLLIALNPEKMAAFGITASQITTTLENNNQNISAGQIITKDQFIQVNANLTLQNVNDFKNLVISNNSGRLITLGDISDVNVIPDVTAGSFAEINGQTAAVLVISASDDANPIEVSKNLRQALQSMSVSFPPGMQYHVLYDIGEPLQQAVTEVYKTMGIAILLVVFVSLFFLGSIRTTLIPVVTIPICLITTFAIMLLFGFTINVMTLLAFVLGVGLVVDDAIVVLENCVRHMESGLAPMAAAQKSLHEISFAVLGMTLCLIAIYIPIIFMPASMVATYSQEFAFTLAGAVTISGFVALTLTPMMCARVLKQREQNSNYEDRLNHLTHALQSRYQGALNTVLNHRRIMVLVFMGFLALTGLMYKILPTELLPSNELGYIWGEVSGPSSANNEYMGSQAQKLLNTLTKQYPQIENYLIGTDNVGYIFIWLQMKENDSSTNDNIANQINTLIQTQYPALNGGVGVMNVNQMGGNDHQGNFYFYILGLADYTQISTVAQNMVNALKNYPGVNSPINGIQFTSQTINLTINRDYATSLGVNIDDINTAIATLFGGYTAQTQYQVGGYGYPIVVQLPFSDLQNFSILNTTYVKNSSGELIPLSSLVSVQTVLDLPYRTHVNLLRAGEVDANIAPGYTTGQAIDEVNKLAKNLPPNLSISFSGQMSTFAQEISAMNVIFLLGAVFIYLVLAALFESFIDPLIMLVAIPPCILGALFALWLMRGSVNIYTSISLVTLIGLVSKHGVLITQFSNHLRQQQGLDVVEAVKRAASIRLRPILMTSLTMILGALPLIFASGTDAYGRRQIGVVIVFGLLVGTFFSLFVVPVAYTILARFKHRFKNRL